MTSKSLNMKSCITYSFILLSLIISNTILSNDTIYISDLHKELNFYRHISILEDSTNTISIEQIIASKMNQNFRLNKFDKLNFEFSTSTFWLKFIIANKTNEVADYILEIPNPDIDHLNFYQVSQGRILKKTVTGELHNAETREIYHRYFLFNIKLNSGESGEYYLSVYNTGHSLTVPIAFVNRNDFLQNDRSEEYFHWLIYGLLIFIIIFNAYLYWSTDDKVNLYNALNIFFATVLLLLYDNYIFFLNPPILFEKAKWLSASLYTFFLITFTQAFIGENSKFKIIRISLTPLKVLAIITALFYPLKYPFSLVSDIGLPIIILISQVLLIFIAFAYYKRSYPPSVLLCAAFCSVFLGLVMHELKEMNLLNLNFFVLNSLKLGLTLEGILLTLAVLERFRINMEQAKNTIEESYNRIEIQNKELEIINTELEKLSIVASETNNNVAIYDPSGRLEWCNTQFERFYKTNLDALIKTKKDSIEHLVPNQEIRRQFEKCLTTRAHVTFETHIRTEENNEIWVQTTLTPLVSKNKVYRLIAIDSDITQLKQFENSLRSAKEKAVESDRLKTVFLGNMSHEIRTPLNGIMGFSDLLTYTSVNEEKRQKYLKMITSNGEQLLRIIDDIIDISLIESNQLKFHPVAFDITQLLKGVVDLFEIFKTKIEKQHIDLLLEINLKPKEYMIVSDPIRIKQILNNLLRNGLKFTKEGYVKIVCSKAGSAIHFSIEDSGIGIDMAKKEIIFERFRQADERVSREFGGTGLGLSISKGIIEKMNGKIWVDPDYTHGLKICFTLPFAEAGEFDRVGRTDIIEDSIPDIQFN
jgi:signal transduction histidine kinase